MGLYVYGYGEYRHLPHWSVLDDEKMLLGALESQKSKVFISLEIKNP